MTDICRICGKPIYAVRASVPIVTLNRYYRWRHFSLLSGVTHSAVGPRTIK